MLSKVEKIFLGLIIIGYIFSLTFTSYELITTGQGTMMPNWSQPFLFASYLALLSIIFVQNQNSKSKMEEDELETTSNYPLLRGTSPAGDRGLIVQTNTENVALADATIPPSPLERGSDALNPIKNPELTNNSSSFEGGGLEGRRMSRSQMNTENGQSQQQNPPLFTVNYSLPTWSLLVAISTFLIEAIGTKTGLIFGEYNYGSSWSWQIFNVPILIGLCWVVVTLGAMQIAQKITSKTWLQVTITGLIAVFADIFIEPVAIRFDYWQWTGGEVPLQNYLAWFVIAVGCAILYKAFKIQTDLPLARYFLVAQTIFMMILNVILTVF